MIENRKFVAVWLLFALSAGMPAFSEDGGLAGDSLEKSPMRGLFEWDGMEKWGPLLVGWITVAVGLLIHVFVIRKFLPIHRLTTQWVGILFSVFLAIVNHELLMVTLNGSAFAIPHRLDLYLWCILFTVTGWIWFPLLVKLELWAYDMDSSEQKQG